MTNDTLESPVDQLAADAPKEPQPRDHGRFAEKPPAPKVNEGIQKAQGETMESMRDALREAAGIKTHPKETDAKALDGVKPKGKDPEAKTDPASKRDSATDKAKPEPSSKDATRPDEKKLAKARKALELEGWSEEDLADLADDKLLSIGTKYQEKHAKADREKREAAEAAKKAPKPDPAKSSATDSETASEQDDDLSEYVKAAEEHFKGFEAETDEGTKAFRTAQAKFAKATTARAIESVIQSLFSEEEGKEGRVTLMLRGVRGEANLNRALDRVAIDIPQVDETDVRQKLTSRIAALASDPDTAEEMKRDLRSVIRREAVALGLKDVAAERQKEEHDELRAAKNAGQPFTGHREAGPDRELEGMDLIRGSLRDAYMRKPG